MNHSYNSYPGATRAEMDSLVSIKMQIEIFSTLEKW